MAAIACLDRARGAKVHPNRPETHAANPVNVVDRSAAAPDYRNEPNQGAEYGAGGDRVSSTRGSDDHGWLAQGASADSTEVRAYYDDWAKTYDDTLRQWGYEAPDRVAQRMAARLNPSEAAILDAGCGTGMTGLALQKAGFKAIDGLDLSPESVKIAALCGAYRNVLEHSLEQPLPFAGAAYDGIQCVGVFTYLSDPEAVLREFARVTRPGGTLIFTQRSDLYESLSFDDRLGKLDAEPGLWHIVDRSEPSPYLPNNPDFADRVQVIYCVCERR